MNSISEFLYQYLDNFPFLEAIVLSDRDGIEIFSAYRFEDSLIKENQAATMFVAGLNGSNENLMKLSSTKINGITLFYDNFLVYIENMNGYFFVVFGKADGNISMIKQIAADVRVGLEGLSAELEKISANFNKI